MGSGSSPFQAPPTPASALISPNTPRSDCPPDACHHHHEGAPEPPPCFENAGWSPVNLPNALTVVRIFLVPLLMVFLIANARPSNYPAVAIFLAAVFTDWLDGFLARSRKQVTTLGQLLDPVADKLLIAAALISFVQVGRVPAWVVVLVVGRDIAVTGLRGIAASQGILIPASSLGKYKMVAEVMAVTFLMLDLGLHPLGDRSVTLGHLFLGVAVVLGIASGVGYFLRFWRQMGFERKGLSGGG